MIAGCIESVGTSCQSAMAERKAAMTSKGGSSNLVQRAVRRTRYRAITFKGEERRAGWESMAARDEVDLVEPGRPLRSQVLCRKEHEAFFRDPSLFFFPQRKEQNCARCNFTHA